MLKEPKNYEEAKQIIVDSTYSKDSKRYLNMLRLRAGLVTSIGTGVAFVISHVLNNPELLYGLLTGVGAVGIMCLTPVLSRKITVKRMRDGSFFKTADASVMMEVAKQYVEAQNKKEKGL